jgi:hypothetical protein
MFLKFLLCFSLFTSAHTLFARELTDMTLDVATANKQEAFDRATEEVTLKLTEDLMGQEKAAKVWPAARARLLKNSTRYIVFIKGSTPAEGASEPHIQVQMRLSIDNLETLLRELGLMGSGTVRLLPLVLISEPRGSRYAWWADFNDEKKPTEAQELFKKFIQQLSARFKGKNVYVLDPSTASFRMNVPSAYRSEGLRREDQILLAQYLKADAVISGRLEISKGEGSGARLNYDMQLWQTKAGRGLSEAQRSDIAYNDAPKALMASMEQSNDKVISEFADKLNEAMATGSLNLNIVRLMVEGSLSYKQQVEFKKELSSLRDIKFLRERLFEPSRVVYEAETGLTGTDLGQALKKARFPQFRVDVSGAQDDSLALAVKAL